MPGPVVAEVAAAERHVLEYLVTLFQAASGSLCRYDATRDRLRLVAGLGLPAEALGQDIAPGDGVLGQVFRSGAPVIINGDVAADGRFVPGRFPADPRRARSAICWPVRGSQGIVGVLSLNRGGDRPAFAPEDLGRGAAAVELLAIATENLDLREQAQAQVAQLQQLNRALAATNRQLAQSQEQLLQAEKMAAVGQLAAGVAHEINNPTGYVRSNLATLQGYLQELFELLDALQATAPAPGQVAALDAVRGRVDAAFLRRDTADLLRESREGLGRIQRIVEDLKGFAHRDDGEWKWSDLNAGLDSTLNVVWNELKYKAEVVKQYGELPQVECLPAQINQVFMNLLVNAAQAIATRGRIVVRSGSADGQVWIEIEDNGCGIAPEHLERLFEPFFTTKPVGKGTGLGLSIAYNIVKTHHGAISVRSTPGAGTTFRVVLPVHRVEAAV